MKQNKCTSPADAKVLISKAVAAVNEKGGIKNVYCVACGGSMGCFYPMTYFLQQEAENIPCESISSNEFAHAAPKALGPQSIDSKTDLLPVIKTGSITDKDLLGLSLNGNTLLVNFAPSFSAIQQNMTADEERLLAYAIVNTLCTSERMKSVCFFESGTQFEGTPGGVYWPGLFYPLPE